MKVGIIQLSILSLTDENVCALHIKSSAILRDKENIFLQFRCIRDLSFKGLPLNKTITQSETEMLLASDFKEKI